MTITQEQLDALAVGSEITVQGRSWQKTDQDAWSSDVFTVRGQVFASDIAQGRVSVGPNFQAGQLWDEGRYGYMYLLLGRDETQEHRGQWWVVQLQPRDNDRLNGRIRMRQTTRIRQPESMVWQRVTDVPNWLPMLNDLANLWMAEHTANHSARQQLQNLNVARAEDQRAVESQQESYRSRLADRLHTWARNFSHEAITDGDFGDILEEFQMPRPAYEVEVHIEAYGMSQIPAANPHDLLPQGAELNGEARTAVPYKVALMATRNVQGGACACEQVSRADVQNLMVDAGYDHEELDEFELSCENCA